MLNRIPDWRLNVANGSESKPATAEDPGFEDVDSAGQLEVVEEGGLFTGLVPVVGQGLVFNWAIFPAP